MSYYQQRCLFRLLLRDGDGYLDAHGGSTKPVILLCNERPIVAPELKLYVQPRSSSLNE